MTTGQVDTVVFGTAISGTASVTTATTAINADKGDSINGFVTTSDKLQFKAAVLNSIDGVTTTAGTAFAAAQALTSVQLKVFATGTNLAAVTSGTGARFIFNADDSKLYLDVTGDSTSSSGTITDAASDDILIATLVGITTIVVGDFVIVA